MLGVGEGHLFHDRKAQRLLFGDFAKSGSLFQSLPSRFSCWSELKMLGFHKNHPEGSRSGYCDNRRDRYLGEDRVVYDTDLKDERLIVRSIEIQIAWRDFIGEHSRYC